MQHGCAARAASVPALRCLAIGWSDLRHVLSRLDDRRCLEGMTDQRNHQGRRHRRRLLRNTGGQPSAVARRRRYHPGQPAAEVRRTDPAAPTRGRQRRRDGRLRQLLGEGMAARRRHRHPYRHRRSQSAACVGRRAGLRLRDLRGRQHRCGAGVGSWRGRIRLPHSGIRAGAAAAGGHRRATPRRPGHRRRRRD